MNRGIKKDFQKKAKNQLPQFLVNWDRLGLKLIELWSRLRVYKHVSNRLSGSEDIGTLMGVSWQKAGMENWMKMNVWGWKG